MTNNDFSNLEEQQNRALRRQQQRFEQQMQRGRGRGKAFDKSAMALKGAQAHLKGFQNPVLTKEEEEQFGIQKSSKRRAHINKRAQSARALVDLANDIEADPKAREFAQKQVEELGLDSWLELHDMSEQFHDLTDITEPFSHNEISQNEYQRRLQQMSQQNLDPNVRKALEQYQTLVPLHDKFKKAQKLNPTAQHKTMRVYDPDQENVEQKKRTYTDYRVSDGQIKDTNGNLIMRPTQQNDMRAPGLAAKLIDEFMLDNSDDPKNVQKKGKMYIPVMMQGASKTTKDMYDGTFDKMKNLPNGKQLAKSYGINQPQVSIDM